MGKNGVKSVLFTYYRPTHPFSEALFSPLLAQPSPHILSTNRILSVSSASPAANRRTDVISAPSTLLDFNPFLNPWAYSWLPNISLPIDPVHGFSIRPV